MAVADRIVDFRRIPAADLRANPKNWRRHPGNQARALRGVLERVGYADALVARQTPEGLELIDGHLRAETTPDQEVPVLVVDVTAEEADLLLAALDPLAGMAQTDQRALRDLLGGLNGLLGEDLAEWLEEIAGPEPREPRGDPEKVPEPRSRPRVKVGDLWILGEHRLVCGDSIDPTVLEQATGGEPVHAVWTDPPYNVNYRGKSGDALTILNDDHTATVFEAWLTEAFRGIFYAARTGAPIYVCHPDGGPAGVTFRRGLAATGWEWKQVLIWVKSNFVLSRQDYHWQHEPIMYGWKPGRAHRWYGGYLPSTVIDEDVDPAKMSKAELVEALEQVRAGTTIMREDRPARNTDHPTIKPVGLVTRALENSTRPKHLVLDPFVGSGSALIAAEMTGRRARAVDLDPVYVDVTIRRWEEYTGQSAEKA